MLNQSLEELTTRTARPGRIDWIGLRTVKRAPLQLVEEVKVSPETGLVGDHYNGRSGTRHVTLIQAEHLSAIASFLGREAVDPGLLRRNLLVSGLNLLALKDRRIRIGEEVILEITGPCHPCSRMEANLGPGGYNAVRGHGGMTARVVQGGIIRLGDLVVPL